METKFSGNTTKMIQMSLLFAIILLMAFTPIGYIKTFGLEITLIVVPVVVGAIILGPKAGAFLGGVFGITSFIQCFGISLFGTALLNESPIFTFIVCVIPRILMGWLTGIIFEKLNKNEKTKNISYFISNLLGPILNTVFFMSTLIILFYNTEFIQNLVSTMGASNPLNFVILFVGINGVVEAIVCFVVGTAISKALNTVSIKRN